MKAKVNDRFEFDLEQDENIRISGYGDKLTARIAGVNHPVRIISSDRQTKRYEIEINKRIYSVRLEDKLDQLIHSMGLKGKRNHKVSEIRSPMPGLVFKLLKKEGDAVTVGETLLILEAMKMENAIKSPVDATISSVEVAEGQAVDKGMILVKFQ